MSTYHHGDLPSALLRAGSQVLEKQGAGPLTLRGVARRAGVSHNAPYRHFADRETLLAALAAEGFDKLAAAVAALPPARMGEAYVSFALKHPQRFRLMFDGSLSLAKHPQLREAARRSHEGIAATFRARSDLSDPEAAAAAAWALTHGLARLILDGHLEGARGDAPVETFVRRVLGTVRFAGTAQRGSGSAA